MPRISCYESRVEPAGYLKQTSEGVLLYCLIAPRASVTELAGVHGDPPRLKIKLKAPPVDGAANEALIAFLSKHFKVPKSKIEIVSGHAAKQKTVLIRAGRNFLNGILESF